MAVWSVVVVMRCTTLKATADKLGRLLDYYAGFGEDRERPGRLSRGAVDYYLDPDEPPGQWWGSGRGALGLDGEVTGAQLGELLDGRHPTTGAKLGRKFGAKSARGFDCTFSAPKSISVLWALTPDPGCGPRCSRLTRKRSTRRSGGSRLTVRSLGAAPTVSTRSTPAG